MVLQHTEETKLKISKSRLGQKHSDETKLKMSNSRIGKPCPWNEGVKEKFTCPICGKTGGKTAMIRYHGIKGEKCKTLQNL